mmetsp:Transcript_75970/g.180699  ORF Transcript_75970/g.180699 Transcript_75970/m.180699 type:complete len:277 (+) Transcript_75970:1222-2052(+)
MLSTVRATTMMKNRSSMPWPALFRKMMRMMKKHSSKQRIWKSVRNESAMDPKYLYGTSSLLVSRAHCVMIIAKTYMMPTASTTVVLTLLRAAIKAFTMRASSGRKRSIRASRSKRISRNTLRPATSCPLASANGSKKVSMTIETTSSVSKTFQCQNNLSVKKNLGRLYARKRMVSSPMKMRVKMAFTASGPEKVPPSSSNASISNAIHSALQQINARIITSVRQSITIRPASRVSSMSGCPHMVLVLLGPTMFIPGSESSPAIGSSSSGSRLPSSS